MFKMSIRCFYEYDIDMSTREYAELIRNLIWDGYDHEHDDDLFSLHRLISIYNKPSAFRKDIPWDVYIQQMIQQDCGTELLTSFEEERFDMYYNYSEMLETANERGRVINGEQIRINPDEMKVPRIIYEIQELEEELGEKICGQRPHIKRI